MKHKKSIILILLTVLLTLPAYVKGQNSNYPMLAAGDDFKYQGIWYTIIDADAKTCKTKEGRYDSETTTYIPGNNVEGDLIIPAIVSDGINNYSVTEIGEYAFSNCSNLTSIDIPESVSTISSYAFMYCRTLTYVNIPESVTSIEWGAFAYCI